jgi:biopolymer transport protein TolQ
MNSDPIHLILNASPFVQAILAILLLASISSWAVIVEKSRLIKRAMKSASEFETSFWSGGDLNNLYRDLARKDATPHGMAGIFEAGFREFGRLKQESGLSTDQLIEGSRRAMRVSQLREMDRLENNLAFLATVSNTSPYVGLFGTVVGIINSFNAIGAVQSATIAMVAPGISDALIATAMGLVAAIPAGIAFNRYADKVSRLEVRYDTFMEELSAIFQRNAARRDSSIGDAAAPARVRPGPTASRELGRVPE